MIYWSHLVFLINHRKSELIPTQHFTYLGLAWNTVDLTVSLTEERVLKIRKKAQLVFDSQVVTCRQAAALEGSIISAMDAVPYARAKGRRLQQALSAIDLSDNDYSKILVVTEKIRNEARFWTVLAFDWFRQIKEPVATQVITTDAVPGVLGVELEGETAAAEVPSQYKEESINVHELLALHFGLHKFKDRLHRIILWQVDNEAARWSILNQGSSKSKVLNDLSLEILDFCQEIDVQVIPRRIESEANLVADSVSRGKRIQDWSLSSEVADAVFRVYGTPTIDMMATRDSRKVEKFWGWRKDPWAEGIDSLSPLTCWKGLGLLYVFPPPPLLGRVLNKIRHSQVKRAIVIAPWWPSKTWFPSLLNMSLQIRRIAMRKKMVTNLEDPEEVIQARSLRLVACMVSGQPDQGSGRTLLHQQHLSSSLHGGEELKLIMAHIGDVGQGGLENIQYKNLIRL